VEAEEGLHVQFLPAYLAEEVGSFLVLVEAVDVLLDSMEPLAKCFLALVVVR